MLNKNAPAKSYFEKPGMFRRYWRKDHVDTRCPFCSSPKGYIDEITVTWEDDGNYFFISCPRCKANGPKRKTQQQAYLAWNNWGRWMKK